LFRSYEEITNRFKVEADAKTSEKAILDEAVKTIHQKVDNNVNISTENLLAATKHLNAMINWIDPPFNYKQLPAIALTVLGFGALLTGKARIAHNHHHFFHHLNNQQVENNLHQQTTEQQKPTQ
jgi:hypothetical protein